MKLFALVLALVALSPSVHAESGEEAQRLALSLELLKDANEPLSRRLAGAETLIMKASEDRLGKYLGLEVPYKFLMVKEGRRVETNVTKVGHKLVGKIAPIRPDVQLQFEVASMVLVRGLVEEARKGELKEDFADRLARVALVATAVVGAQALDKDEQDVWDMVRAKAAERALTEAPEFSDLYKDHDKNVKDLIRDLKGLAGHREVPEGLRNDIRLMLEIRLK